jgi:stress-induced morphogen
MSHSPIASLVSSIKCALEASPLGPITHCEISGEHDSCGAKLDAVIVSAKFEGMPLLQRQKAVHEAVSKAKKLLVCSLSLHIS